MKIKSLTFMLRECPSKEKLGNRTIRNNNKKILRIIREILRNIIEIFRRKCNYNRVNLFNRIQ